MTGSAVVLVSGGLDSATTLAIARAAGFRCYALTLDYGQTHGVELEAARDVVASLGVDSHQVMNVDLAAFGGSALTDPSIAVPLTRSVGIPSTYVPARNTVMLAIALAWSEALAAEAVFIGVNAVDYSGYPDCRPAFIEAFQNLAKLATKAGVEGREVRIEAPLIDLDKAAIIRAGARLGVNYAMTVSCYRARADRRACGTCDACYLRRRGFAGAGITDPTAYVSP